MFILEILWWVTYLSFSISTNCNLIKICWSKSDSNQSQSSFLFQAESLASLGKNTDKASSYASSEITYSRPSSNKSRVSSAKLRPPPTGNHRPEINRNMSKLASQQVSMGDGEFIGLDVFDVIKKLRQRLNMSIDLDAIANGEDPDEDENNINRLYLKEDDGKFLYCLPKNRDVRAARYNPYDLICVPSREAQSSAQYFTVTASAVTQVC